MKFEWMTNLYGLLHGMNRILFGGLLDHSKEVGLTQIWETMTLQCSMVQPLDKFQRPSLFHGHGPWP